MDTQSNSVKSLSVFALSMISVAAIVNLSKLPIMASVGLSSVFFYLSAGLVFLIPSSLICAELSSSLPQGGGVYLWVKQAFGDKVGFFAIWSEWFNNVIGWPSTMSFIAATIAYIFIPNINQHKYIMFAMMLAIIWGCTLINFYGIKISSRINMAGALLGSLLPGTIIVILGVVWLASGKPININFSLHSLIPPMHLKNLVFFVGVLGGYAGMQIIAFHAPDVKQPHRDFPKAIAISVLLIMLLTILASLAIAVVVPQNQLSLVSGVIQGFSGFFKAFHLSWALPILVLLIAISGISNLTAWLLGPARGIAVAAEQHLFPSWFAKRNKHNMPTNLLVLQAILSSCLASVFLFASSFSTAFWMLVVLTSQFTLIMNILMFASVVKLRYSHSDLPRPFKIPGGKLGVWFVAGIGIIVCTLGILLGYLPPASLKIKNLHQYEAFLIMGNLLYLILPIIIYTYSTRNAKRSAIQISQ